MREESPAAYFKILVPVTVEPVKASFEILVEVPRAAPASLPNPLTILTTPGGSKSPTSSIKIRVPTGVCSAGFSTTQFPAAKAGASFQAKDGLRISRYNLSIH